MMQADLYINSDYSVYYVDAEQAPRMADATRIVRSELDDELAPGRGTRTGVLICSDHEADECPAFGPDYPDPGRCPGAAVQQVWKYEPYEAWRGYRAKRAGELFSKRKVTL